MLTRWGRALDPDAVLPEYPRPQLVRDSYLNLNGRWEYAFADREPEVYEGEIIWTAGAGALDLALDAAAAAPPALSEATSRAARALTGPEAVPRWTRDPPRAALTAAPPRPGIRTPSICPPA